MSALLVILLASLLGSFHCAGMCGAFVAFAVGTGQGAGKWRTQAAYHGGRLATYAALGAAAGGMGGLVDLAAKQAQFQHGAAWLAGGLMVAAGLLMLFKLWGGAGRWKPPALLVKWAAAGHRLAAPLPPGGRALAIGLLTFLLPCGWLWQFVIMAGGTGSAGGGALLMAAFWLGTVPMLSALGFGVRKALGAAWPKLATVGALLIITLGVWTAIARGNTDMAGWVRQKVAAKQAESRGTGLCGTPSPAAGADPADCPACAKEKP